MSASKVVSRGEGIGKVAMIVTVIYCWLSIYAWNLC